MTKQAFDELVGQGFRLLSGRCAIHLERPPDKVGSIVIPGTAQEHEVKAEGYAGRVLRVRRTSKEWDQGLGFYEGDRVCVGLHADELREEVVIIRNAMVVAVLG
jgi:hypothetical protein